MFKPKILFPVKFWCVLCWKWHFLHSYANVERKELSENSSGHREGWANKFLPPPRRPSTRREDPVWAGRLSGAEECCEKLLKRSELWSLSRANKSRQQCDAPQGILKRGALGLIRTLTMRRTDSLTHEGLPSSHGSQQRGFLSSSTLCKSMFRKACRSLVAKFYSWF